LTKQEFIDKVAEEAGLSRRDAQKAVDSVLETISSTLQGGGEINFTGFGKFSTSQRAARQGVNPRTGERVQIPATVVPKFSAGSALKGAVKSGAGA
jgi:DNA-binding protein HU-beta